MNKDDQLLTYKQEEIFSEDPNNPDNVMMKIPDEIMKKKGWGPGTAIKIKVGDQGTIIIEEVKDKGENKSKSVD